LLSAMVIIKHSWVLGCILVLQILFSCSKSLVRPPSSLSRSHYHFLKHWGQLSIRGGSGEWDDNEASFEGGVARNPFEITETCIGRILDGGISATYLLHEDGKLEVSSSTNTTATTTKHRKTGPATQVWVASGLAALARRTFLPVGFPGTVAPEYLRVQAWNNLQHLSSCLRGVLATQAILEGMGVGDAGTTALAATIQWIIRDGASMVGGLVFTSLVSANFSKNVKTWRLFADLVNNAALTLDMVAPMFRRYFLVLICASSVLKALCGVSAGATGAAITEHLSERNNIAEVGAKNGAQGTAVSLAGLAVGIWFAQVANVSASRVWAFYSALTALHVWANLRVVRALALRSLNPARLAALLPAFFATGGCLSRNEVASKETLFFHALKGKAKVRFGSSLSSSFDNPVELRWLLHTYRSNRYILNLRQQDGKTGTELRSGIKNRLSIDVVFHQDCSPEDHLQAFFQVHYLQHLLSQSSFPGSSSSDSSSGVSEHNQQIKDMVLDSLQYTKSNFLSFKEQLVQQGFDLNQIILLDSLDWVARWDVFSQSATTRT